MSPWVEIGPASEVFNDLRLLGGSLLAATARNGVFLQEPAFTGSWISLGFKLSNPRLIFGVCGAYSLGRVGDYLLVGMWDCFPAGLYRSSHDTPLDWSESDAGMDPDHQLVYAIHATEAGIVLALSSHRFYVSPDSGNTWLGHYTPGVTLSGVFHEGPGGLWLGLEYFQGSTLVPGLWHLSNTGDYLGRIALEGKLRPDSDTQIYSVVTTSREDSRLLLACGRRVYVSNDGGETFEVVLEAAESVHLSVNEADELEYVAVADSLYYSGDGGKKWVTTALPGKKIGPPAISWHDRWLAVPVVDGWGGTVYRLKLEFR